MSTPAYSTPSRCKSNFIKAKSKKSSRNSNRRRSHGKNLSWSWRTF